MKTCVSSYSFGRYLSVLGIEGAVDKAAEMGFEGMEFVEGDWSSGLSAKLAKELRKRVEDHGMTPVSFCVGNDFLDCAGETFEEKIEKLKRKVDFAAELGVQNMRHDISQGTITGKNNKGEQTAPEAADYDKVLPVLAEGCRIVSQYAKSAGVGTMTENHGFFSQDALRVEKLKIAADCDNFGLLVDIGNFMCVDEDPISSVKITAKYARHVHCKDFLFKKNTEMYPGDGWFGTRGGNYLRGTVLGHGVVPVAKCLEILRNSGYDGFVSLEFEGLEDNLESIRRGLDFMKRCI